MFPKAMEDKWFWYTEGSTLFAHRSRTGYCIYKIDFGKGCRHTATVNREPEQYGCTDWKRNVRPSASCWIGGPSLLTIPVGNGSRKRMIPCKRRGRDESRGKK